MGRERRPDRPVDIPALHGPTGNLDRDVRSLLAAITDPILYEKRRVRLRALLQQIENDRNRKTRRAVARALWPMVQALLAHNVEMAVMQTARYEDRLAKLRRDTIFNLDLLRAYYFPIDKIREPVETLQREIARFEQLPADEQQERLDKHGIDKKTPRRQKTRGRPHLRVLNATAKTALEPFVDEDESALLRHLVGLVPNLPQAR